MYHLIDRLHTLYGLLQDEQSKDIFQARFAVDMAPSMAYLSHLASLGSCKDNVSLKLDNLKSVLKQLNQEHKKVIIYGTGQTGRLFAGILQLEHIDFYGFCGRRAEKFPNGLLGKPVLSPSELVNAREYYVVPAVTENAYKQIFQFLQEHSYPEERILNWVNVYGCDLEKQYFEFPALYRRGTAFIDGGCYDCGSSYKFAEWCGGAYSSIIAFEPDPNNYAKCCKKVQDTPLPNFQLVNAGLSSQEGTIMFDARSSNSAGSRIIDTGTESDVDSIISIRTAAIDGIVGNQTVGFIKMDIEGAELDALRGARDTIVRDKPLLAISVYHLRGDVFAIMDYLHQLLPEYRFLLRHYGSTMTETVLYASVNL